MIKSADPKAQYLSHKRDIDHVVKKVMTSGQYVLGSHVKKFEKFFAKYCGTKYSVGVGSGTEAIHLSLRALDIGEGDEVITTAHTAVATVSAIALTGANPVFADIDADHFTISTESIKKVITKKTKAIIIVHIYGQPCKISEIKSIAKKNNLYVIEDCAQAHGAKYREKSVGSLFDVGCFSFYPTKNLGAIGDGGAVTTNNLNLYKKLVLLREYGWKEKFQSSHEGWNSRLDEIQAAILNVKLKTLDKSNNLRIKIANYYNKNITNPNIIKPRKYNLVKHVYHLYVIRVKERDKLMSFLKENKVATSIQYPTPIHKQKFYKYKYKDIELPNTESIAKQILSLPIYPELDHKSVRRVVKLLNNFKIH